MSTFCVSIQDRHHRALDEVWYDFTCIHGMYLGPDDAFYGFMYNKQSESARSLSLGSCMSKPNGATFLPSLIWDILFVSTQDRYRTVRVKVVKHFVLSCGISRSHFVANPFDWILFQRVRCLTHAHCLFTLPDVYEVLFVSMTFSKGCTGNEQSARSKRKHYLRNTLQMTVNLLGVSTEREYFSVWHMFGFKEAPFEYAHAHIFPHSTASEDFALVFELRTVSSTQTLVAKSDISLKRTKHYFEMKVVRDSDHARRMSVCT